MNKILAYVRSVLLVIVLFIIAYPLCSSQTPEPLPIKVLTLPAFLGIIGSLFAIALFIERAVEVVVMVLRDRQTEALDEEEECANKNAAETLAKNAAAAPTDKEITAKEAGVARQALADVRQRKLAYRAETKEFALSVSFAFSALVSLAGVRALHGLLVDSAAPGRLFTMTDVLVTSAMLAGGSEGIHRIANVFTSFMDNLSNRADQAQKKP